MSYYLDYTNNVASNIFVGLWKFHFYRVLWVIDGPCGMKRVKLISVFLRSMFK